MGFDFVKENLSLFVRDEQIGHLLETFLLSAVSSILIIRFFLSLTGYPQLGGNGLHIAHVLWGGFFMAVGLLIALSFLNKEAKQVAAVVGGIGFGTFIDELGKFITADNNYFYRPTVAIIYVVFIILFLLYRTVEKYRKLTDKEYEVNALELLKEVIAHDFDEKEKRKIIQFLEKSDSEEDFIKELKKLVSKVETIPQNERPLSTRLKKFIRKIYLSVIDKKWFDWSFVGFFIVNSLINLWVTFYYIPQISNQPFSEKGELVFSLVSGVLVLIGVVQLSTSRLKAYYMFKRSILVSIFLTQFFIFFEDQLSALVGLVFSLLILGIVQYMIEEERLNIRERG